MRLGFRLEGAECLRIGSCISFVGDAGMELQEVSYNCHHEVDGVDIVRLVITRGLDTDD